MPEYKLLEIPRDDVRISYIYSILVKQWSLSDEAYRFFRTQKLYTEESSGLFTPMPTEISGNVYPQPVISKGICALFYEKNMLELSGNL